MADLASRPRPRPRAKPAIVSNSVVSILESKASSSSSPPPQSPIEDEDALFMKNTRRDVRAWKRLELLDVQQLKQIRPCSTEDDEETSDIDLIEVDFAPRPRKRGRPAKKKQQKPETELPSWTKSKDIASLLSTDIAGDASEDLTILAPDTPRDPCSASATRQRPRSRSRSITPPPPLSAHTLQNARNVVRRTLLPDPRPPSPMALGDDSTDTIVLDPELAMIAEKALARRSASAVASGGPSEIRGGPESVRIKVKWRPHPADDAGQIQTWMCVIGRYDTFKDLFEETADLATILSDSLIMTYDGQRVFSSVTPHSLGIWAEAELEACTKVTYDYIRTHQHPGSPRQAYVEAAQLFFDDEAIAVASAAEESDTESTGGETFKIVLRSEGRRDVTVTVRPTTKCQAIVREFMKRAGLTAPTTRQKGRAAAPALVVDGDKLDPESEIGEADLEDGDQVEVVGV